MSPLRISVEMPPNDEDRVRLADALLSHSRARFGDPTAKPIGLFLRDEQGELCGGLTGNLRWKWLYVDMLWIRDDLRNRGYGSHLLADAEDFARASGGVAVHLDTGGDEALPFYLKRGYVVFGTLDGFPPGAKQYFLQKHLEP